jgi:hypothetical protein
VARSFRLFGAKGGGGVRGERTIRVPSEVKNNAGTTDGTRGATYDQNQDAVTGPEAAVDEATGIPQDLSAFLAAFSYVPGRVQARMVPTRDGRKVVQVRIELGVVQMEYEGRPDGLPSVLDDERSLAEPSHAADLRIEVAQIQQRAVALLSLGEPQQALRDSDRVLSALRRLAQQAPIAEREWAEGARFSALVFRTRAAVAVCLQQGRTRDAMSAIDGGLQLLEVQAERLGIAEQFDGLADVRALQTLHDSLQPQLPPAQRAELEARLAAAVRAENYELAAILRDELRRM